MLVSNPLNTGNTGVGDVARSPEGGICKKILTKKYSDMSSSMFKSIFRHDNSMKSRVKRFCILRSSKGFIF